MKRRQKPVFGGGLEILRHRGTVVFSSDRRSVQVRVSGTWGAPAANRKLGRCLKWFNGKTTMIAAMAARET